MQSLYLWDNCACPQKEAWETASAKLPPEDDGESPASDGAPGKKISPASLQFGIKLFEGILAKKDEIDPVIQRYALNWTLNRMAAVDRNIIRIAAYEILFMPETPVKVIINEAVEVAKAFSTDDSGKFVNGILDKLKNEREQAGGSKS